MQGDNILNLESNVANWTQKRLRESKVAHYAVCQSREETYVFCFSVLCSVCFMTLPCFGKRFSSNQSSNLSIDCSRVLGWESSVVCRFSTAGVSYFLWEDIIPLAAMTDQWVYSCSQAGQNHELVLISWFFLFGKLQHFLKHLLLCNLFCTHSIGTAGMTTEKSLAFCATCIFLDFTEGIIRSK